MDNKILLVYEDGEEYKIESVWATKVGDYYQIDNIPFFAKNVALGDIVSVDEENGELYYENLIMPSGHSVVQVVFFNESEVESIIKDLENMGCLWEGSHIKTLISIDIPHHILYTSIKEYLNKKFEEGKLDYREACLGFK